MDLKYIKRDGEDSTEYLLRLVEIKLKEKPEDLDWQDIVEYTGFDIHYDSLRKAMQPKEYGAFAIYEYMKENGITSDSVIEQLKETKQELYKERVKLADEKNELRSLLREDARISKIGEKIESAFERILSKKKRFIPIAIENTNVSKQAVLGIADVHWGTDFKIQGFMNDIISEYNTDIAQEKFWKVRDELLDFCKTNNIKKVSLVELGDSINGIIHLSGIKANKGDVVDDIVDYADFFIDFIEEISKDLIVDVYTSTGNHSDLKILSEKRLFKGENLEKIFARMVQKSMRNNPNVNVFKNVNGMNYFNVLGTKIFTVHGQNEKNLLNSIREYSELYHLDIDMLMVGHLHSKKEIDVNGGKEVIQVRSMMGGNDYSILDLKKSSPSGAIVYSIEEGYGKKDTREIKF